MSEERLKKAQIDKMKAQTRLFNIGGLAITTSMLMIGIPVCLLLCVLAIMCGAVASAAQNPARARPTLDTRYQNDMSTRFAEELGQMETQRAQISGSTQPAPTQISYTPTINDGAVQTQQADQAEVNAAIYASLTAAAP